jgi:hypothetical protein
MSLLTFSIKATALSLEGSICSRRTLPMKGVVSQNDLCDLLGLSVATSGVMIEMLKLLRALFNSVLWSVWQLLIDVS